MKCMHLNDSKTPFNSKRDRHEVIGEGSLGEAAFRFVMNDERLVRIPKVIETPKGTDPTAMDAKMMTRLRSSNPDYILSIDAPPWQGYGYDVKQLSPVLDYFNIMMFDCAGPWTAGLSRAWIIFRSASTTKRSSMLPAR